MDRAALSEIAHRRHPLAAPVSTGQAQRLLSWLTPPSGGRAVDLGCESGGWLIELAARHESLTAVGVDLALPGGNQERAEKQGLASRVRWVQADAASWQDGLFDVVICVGASHAFGGLTGTLSAIRRHLRPGGQALLGDTFWETAPTETAQRVLQAGPQDFPDLAGLVELVQAHGFEPGYGHVSTLEEWDDYEWAWTGSLIDWALNDVGHGPDREQALHVAREHRDGWLRGYRRQLGFATLVLHDVTTG